MRVPLKEEGELAEDHVVCIIISDDEEDSNGGPDMRPADDPGTLSAASCATSSHLSQSFSDHSMKSEHAHLFFQRNGRPDSWAIGVFVPGLTATWLIGLFCECTKKHLSATGPYINAERPLRSGQVVLIRTRFVHLPYSQHMCGVSG